jgi:hypothetical protein
MGNNNEWVGSMLTMSLHDTQELHDDLRARSDEDLTFPSSLGIDDVVLFERIDGQSFIHRNDRIYENVQGSRSGCEEAIVSN